MRSTSPPGWAAVAAASARHDDHDPTAPLRKSSLSSVSRQNSLSSVSRQNSLTSVPRLTLPSASESARLLRQRAEQRTALNVGRVSWVSWGILSPRSDSAETPRNVKMAWLGACLSGTLLLVLSGSLLAGYYHLPGSMLRERGGGINERRAMVVDVQPGPSQQGEIEQGSALSVVAHLPTTTRTATASGHGSALPLVANTSTTPSTVTTSATTTSTSTSTTTSCMTPVVGEHCYNEVLSAMDDVRENPERWAGLSESSSFEQVQDFLHSDAGRASSCQQSCSCSTAQPGSRCYEEVMYASDKGIEEHPEWYENLMRGSSFEDFQAHLWRHWEKASCERPCRAPLKKGLSVFCWTLARSTNYEADLMAKQLELGAGIFGCDGFAVLSEQEWTVGAGSGGEVAALTFQGAAVGTSKDGTAGNAALFMRAWQAVLRRTAALSFDWTVKVDPDSVLFADKLRDHLKEAEVRGANKVKQLKNAATFIRNCNAYPGTDGFPAMFGALEVVSRQAVKVYQDGASRCKEELDWEAWGEDLFLSQCLSHLGVPPMDDFSITSDGTCTKVDEHVEVDCSASWPAAFHPFKTADDWAACWRLAAP